MNRAPRTYAFSRLWLGCALLILVAAGPSARGQGYERAVPTIDAEIVIDGRLDEEVWGAAVTIEDFLQIEPTEGAPPSERTVVRLLVDRDHLYIAVECFDSEPALIQGNVVVRDGVLDPDDRVEIVVDTFFDRRSAYFFQINPGGSKGDALVENNGSRFIKEWDGIWKGKARLHEHGWTAEIALPAKTMGMASTHDRFGFNARRYIKRKNEAVEWAYPDRTKGLFQMANAGVLTGLAVLDPGLGIDFKPFVTGNVSRDRHGGNAIDGDLGFDLSYRITSDLKATLTVNTDFAEAEVDERVVNLTRFPTFFPERRDFFLQDAGIFAFGGLRQSPLPFFSRRIGLSSRGEKVPLLTGAKVTGRIDDLNLGVLATYMDESDDAGSKVLGVARATYNVFEQSQVGFIFTYGDPRTDGDNAVAGVDFKYRTNEFLGDSSLEIDTFFEVSQDDPDSESAREEATGYAYGLSVRYPNDEWAWRVGYWEIGDNFRPDLGFVHRGGTRNLLTTFDYRPRPGGDLIRRFEFGFSSSTYWSIQEGDAESFNNEITLLGVLFESGDRVDLSALTDFERLYEPFRISDGIEVGPGSYHFARVQVSASTSDRREVSGALTLSYGSFYTGTRLSVTGSLAWRPLRGLSVRPSLRFNDIELDEGHFKTNLATLRVNYDFSPSLSWSNFAQWDDVSDTLGLNSRVRWIIEPGDDLFFVVNQGIATADERDRIGFRSVGTDLSFKVGMTFRF